MIITENHSTRADGVKLIRTYSDTNHYIERDGILYAEAIDPKEEKRVYTESSELIPPPPFEVADI